MDKHENLHPTLVSMIPLVQSLGKTLGKKLRSGFA